MISFLFPLFVPPCLHHHKKGTEVGLRPRALLGTRVLIASRCHNPIVVVGQRPSYELGSTQGILLWEERSLGGEWEENTHLCEGRTYGYLLLGADEVWGEKGCVLQYLEISKAL